MSEDKKTAYERFLEEFNKNSVVDRMNMVFIITQGLGIIDLLKIAPDYDRERVNEAINGVTNKIADEVRDEQFIKDLENAYDEVDFDPRPIFMNKRVGNKPMEKRKIINYDKKEHAITNLIHRLGMGLKTENKGFVGKTE